MAQKQSDTATAITDFRNRMDGPSMDYERIDAACKESDQLAQVLAMRSKLSDLIRDIGPFLAFHQRQAFKITLHLGKPIFVSGDAGPHHDRVRYCADAALVSPNMWSLIQRDYLMMMAQHARPGEVHAYMYDQQAFVSVKEAAASEFASSQYDESTLQDTATLHRSLPSCCDAMAQWEPDAVVRVFHFARRRVPETTFTGSSARSAKGSAGHQRGSPTGGVCSLVIEKIIV